MDSNNSFWDITAQWHWYEDFLDEQMQMTFIYLFINSFIYFLYDLRMREVGANMLKKHWGRG